MSWSGLRLEDDIIDLYASSVQEKYLSITQTIMVVVYKPRMTINTKIHAK
jgi:hypothetical protein